MLTNYRRSKPMVTTEKHKKLLALRLHIMKELSLTYREFHRLFPQYVKLIKDEELNSTGKRARFARFKIIGR
jgi:hypothetical protein